MTSTERRMETGKSQNNNVEKSNLDETKTQMTHCTILVKNAMQSVITLAILSVIGLRAQFWDEMT